jgi:hypothetical protein
MSTADILAAPKGESPEDHGCARAVWSPAFRLAIVAQAERLVGIGVTFASRWFLSPAELGFYSGLRMLLDNTNRSSLGVALGAIQKSIAERARRQFDASERTLSVAATTNTLTSAIYGSFLILWGIRELAITGHREWGVGMILVGLLAVLKRRQDFQVAVLRSMSEFSTVGHVSLMQNLAFGLGATLGIVAFGFWGLLAALGVSFIIQGALLNRSPKQVAFRPIWDWRASCLLAAAGLPILAANSAWAFVSTVDRALILAFRDDGARLAGYYSLAVLGCGILEDFASRVAIVLAPAFRGEFGLGASVDSILSRAESAGLALLCISAPLGCILASYGTSLLQVLFPNLAPGASALTPLIPGTIALCAAMPLREAWISADRPWIPAIITAAGAIVLAIRIKGLNSEASIESIALESSICRIATCFILFATPACISKWNRARVIRWMIAGVWAGYWVMAYRVFRNPSIDPIGIALSFSVLAACVPIAIAVQRTILSDSATGAFEHQ